MTPLLLRFLRYWLPGLIFAAGVAYGASRGFDEVGIEAMIVLLAAALSLWFMNILLRAGFEGEVERDREDEARRYLDEHGRWPED